MRCDARQSCSGPNGFVAGLHRLLPPFLGAASLDFLCLSCACFLPQRPPGEKIILILWILLWLSFLWVKPCRAFADLNYYMVIDEVWAPTLQWSWHSSSERPALHQRHHFPPASLPSSAVVMLSSVALYAGTSVKKWFIDTAAKAEEIKDTGREWRARAKTEIVTTDSQPHAGNAAWLHHPSHTGLCNSLDTVHSHDLAPICETLIWTTGLISAGARKTFGKIKFVRSKVALLHLPVETW